MDESGAPWLSDAEQCAWRRFLALQRELGVALARGMQASSDLSMADYAVLVPLSETAGGQLRVSELAGEVDWERSRLSHHLKRMQARGLVARSACPDDGRGSNIRLTGAGRAAVADAAPAHARLVRRLVFETLGPQRLDDFDTLLGDLLAAVRAEHAPAGAAVPAP